jgi:hypothetical protein
MRVGWIIAVDIEVTSDDEILNSDSKIEKRCEFVDEHWKRLGIVG